MEKQRRTFLSYSRANKDFAVRLARELKAEGFLVWLDQLDIPLGARWDVEVEKALEECEIFMIIMTPASIASENVRDEIGYAIDNGKRFLPILLENCNVPLRLRRFQYVDFTNKSFDEGVESAKGLLRGLIAQPTMPRIIVSEEERKQLAQAEADRKAREEADQLAEQRAEEERVAKAKAEAERRAKEEADRLAAQKAETERLAQQKAEEERLAKAAAERKAQEEADRITARKAEAERLAKQKAEAERLAAQKANVLPVETKPVPTPTTQKKPVAIGLIFGIVGVALLAICGTAYAIVSKLGTPATAVPSLTDQAAQAELQEQPISTLPVPVPTKTVRPAATGTPAPIPTVSKFFTEEFDSPLSNDWNVLTVTGSAQADLTKVTVQADSGKLVWNFDSEYVYYYMFYDEFDYEDVRLDLSALNLGKNNNSVSLICRYNPDVGWYEFNIANNGLYDIFFAEVKSNGDISYNKITNGGSNVIKQGQNTNEYAITCIGDELTLYINGEKEISQPERKYGLQRGQVGMSVSSFNVLPILIEMDWVQVSEP